MSTLRAVLNGWERWGIEALVIISFFLQIILIIFGNRRRRTRRIWPRIMVWMAYIMIEWVATVGLSKISDLASPGDNLSIEAYDTQISVRLLLAPLLLLHIGSPDGITAYTVEDNLLGFRGVVELFRQVGYVIYILNITWRNSPVTYLILPILLAGIIDYVEKVWALMYNTQYEPTMITSKFKKDGDISKLFKDLPERTKEKKLDLILKAYYRFDRSRPHLSKWLYHPHYTESSSSLSIEDYEAFEDIDNHGNGRLDGYNQKAENVFRITEYELGFLYDALYTKAPCIFSKVGCVLRLVSFFSLLCALIKFSSFIKTYNPGEKSMRHMKFSQVALCAAVIVEGYEGFVLLFSHWTVAQMVKHQSRCQWFITPLLEVVGPISLKRKMWSRRIDQFNIIRSCMLGDYPKFTALVKRVCSAFCMKELFKRFWVKSESTDEGIPLAMKREVLKRIKRIEHKRNYGIVDKRGEWALEQNGITSDNERDRDLRNSINTEFGRSIAMWHIATEICCNLDSENLEIKDTSVKLSQYMMFLLAALPEMLSERVLSTSDFLVDHVTMKLMKIFKQNIPIGDERTACGIVQEMGRKLLEDEDDPFGLLVKDGDDPIEEFKWRVLPEAFKLAANLKRRENKWNIICDVWVEMLCYAACNCSWSAHADQLRRGGEFITHVWILLVHKTNFYDYIPHQP